MIQRCVDGLEKDRQVIQRILREINPENADSIDNANRASQHYLDLGLQILDNLREAVRLATSSGQRIENAADLDKVTEQYRSWKEDLPDRLMMEYAPVQNRIREHITESLRDPPKESDWEDLIDDTEQSRNAMQYMVLLS